MSTGPDDASQSEPGSRIEIKADNNSTAIGSVGHLNMVDPRAVAIGGVASLNVFLPQTPKATTSVLPIAAMRSFAATFVGRQEQLKTLSGFLLDEPGLGSPSVASSLVRPVWGKPRLSGR